MCNSLRDTVTSNPANQRYANISEQVKVACLERGLQTLGVLEGQIEDRPEPLVQVFALLHEASVVLQEVLDRK